MIFYPVNTCALEIKNCSADLAVLVHIVQGIWEPDQPNTYRLWNL